MLDLLYVFNGLGIVSLQVEEVSVVQVKFLRILGTWWIFEYSGLELLDILCFEIGNSQAKPGFQIIRSISQQYLAEVNYLVVLAQLHRFLDELELSMAGTFHENRIIQYQICKREFNDY